MKNVSNKELSKQITKLEGKIEMLFALLERNERTMFSIFGNKTKIRENLNMIGNVYKTAREDLNKFYNDVDKFYNEGE